VYQLGRDKEFRPIIYIDVKTLKTKLQHKEVEIKDYSRALSYLLNGIRMNMYRDYHIEN